MALSEFPVSSGNKIQLTAVSNVSAVITRNNGAINATGEERKTYYFNVNVGNKIIPSDDYPTSSAASTAKATLEALL